MKSLKRAVWQGSLQHGLSPSLAHGARRALIRAGDESASGLLRKDPLT